jgi:hypothetical protein
MEITKDIIEKISNDIGIKNTDDITRLSLISFLNEKKRKEIICYTCSRCTHNKFILS